MNADLIRLRADIERIDRALVDLIRERVSAARSTAAAKRAAGLPTLDPPQEAAVIRRAAALARASGLPAEDVRDVFWRLVALTRAAELAE
ncbi:MAG TPA: chorismate mutase [Gemmatimonadales bacterium]|nr:chorismate mutase [Gemmatimonadales bacterium]